MQLSSVYTLPISALILTPLQTYVNYGTIQEQYFTASNGGSNASYAATKRILDPQASSRRFGNGRVNCAAMAQRKETARLPLWLSMEGQESRIRNLETHEEKYARAKHVVPKKNFRPVSRLAASNEPILPKPSG